METFSAIKIEVLISGAWRDLSADVLQNPPPRVSGIGIMGASVVDRVGEAGTFTFSLNNSASNSGGTLGYYTPTGSSAFSSLWNVGLPVHLYFEYDGIRRYKFYGTIDPDGITPDTGKYKTRTVKVKCSNWLRLAANHKLDLLGYKINQTFDTAARYIINNMAKQPQNTEFYTGQEVFPTVFDVTRTNTKALGEIQKLVFSEWGRAFVRGDNTNGETFVMLDNNWYTRQVDDEPTGAYASGTNIPVKQSATVSNLLLMTGDDLLKMDTSFLLLHETQRADFSEADIESMRWEFGRNVFNHAVFKTYPRKVVTSTVLYTLNEPIELTAGQQIADIRGSYTDPDNGGTEINALNDTVSTAYAAFANSDGTGTNYTTSLGVVADYGTSEVRYTLTNNAAVTIYVTQLQATGDAVLIYDTNDKAYDFAVGQNRDGLLSLEVDMPYLSNINGLVSFGYTGTVWSGFLNGVGFAVPSISSLSMTVNRTSKQMLGFMCLEPSDFVLINETITSNSGYGTYTLPWVIQGYDFEIINGKMVRWNLNLKVQGIA